ncbi:MAG: response regulator [Chloroflexota bacterium]
MPILDTIVLIDDNPADNFYHRIIINDANIASDIIEFEAVTNALHHLIKDGNSERINMIFLDINMPLQDGFSFLENYSKIKPALDTKIVVVILTNSLNQRERRKAEQSSLVDNYLTKPLTAEDLEMLIAEHFLQS